MSCSRCNLVPDEVLDKWKKGRISELYDELVKLEAFRDTRPPRVKHDPANAWCECSFCTNERRINCAG